ncbi:MAG: hypothetical protein BECKG1743E_GA0114224_104743 [Candidatus Kentron sp. G]|nr:MAG: hypothetical protein BECKG1743E_GA0114224_104743 [Candidatus Kentron sp. G]
MGHNPTFAFTSNKSLKDIEKMQFRDFLPFFDTDVIENKQKRAFFLLCALVLIRNFLQYISHYRKSSGVSRIRLICKACRSISDKVYYYVIANVISWERTHQHVCFNAGNCKSRIALHNKAKMSEKAELPWNK